LKNFLLKIPYNLYRHEATLKEGVYWVEKAMRLPNKW